MRSAEGIAELKAVENDLFQTTNYDVANSSKAGIVHDYTAPPGAIETILPNLGSTD